MLQMPGGRGEKGVGIARRENGPGARALSQSSNSHFLFFNIILWIYLFYFWPRWVFVPYGLFSSCSKWRLLSSCSVRASGCNSFSLQWLLLLQSTGSVVVHRLSCSKACGIFPDQGLNQCLLHWQVDSLPLCHQGSPRVPLSPLIDYMCGNHGTARLSNYLFKVM